MNSDALRVLIVDDKEDILELLGEYLRTRGYRVRTAYDGVAGLEIARSEPIDVVLTDMKMPQMGGMELLRAVQDLGRPVAVIMMTGFATVDSAIQALKHGAYDYLLKPFKLRDVYAAIVRASERLRVEQDSARVARRLAFHEDALALDDPSGLAHLCGSLAEVARAELDADEAAVWLDRAGRGPLVARSGGPGRLAAMGSPAVTGEGHVRGDLLVVPLLGRSGRVGAVAVAGGERRADDLRRLRLLARALSEAVARVEGAGDPPAGGGA